VNRFEIAEPPAIAQSKTQTSGAEVMAREEPGYFIHDWQEFRNQVSQMIVEDSRHKAIKSRSLQSWLCAIMTRFVLDHTPHC
jgi:hypothetical protein